MLAILYLLVAGFAGYHLLQSGMSRFSTSALTTSLTGKPTRLAAWMVLIPGGFLTGVLLMTWLTYITAYGLAHTNTPLMYANSVSFSVFLLISLYFVAKRPWSFSSFTNLGVVLRRYTWEIIYISAIALLFWGMTFLVFRIEAGEVLIGRTALGDFGNHIPILRSFSHGSNYPTMFPHFSDSGMPYHFMFDFWAGNMEYLGLRLDYAINVPSVLTYTACFMLLFAFAVLITGSKLVGTLTSILLLLRSSPAIYVYLSKIAYPYPYVISDEKLTTFLTHGLTEHNYWVSLTESEAWMWTLNPYMAQRHTGFGLGLVLLVLIFVLPLFYHPLPPDARNNVQPLPIPRYRQVIQAWAQELKTRFLSKSAWLPQDIKGATLAGCLLGLTAFWNGVTAFSACLILAALGLAARHKLEFLIIGVLTALLSYAQKAFFVWESAMVKPPFMIRPVIGFNSGKFQFVEILEHYIRVFGVLPFALLFAACIFPKKKGVWLLLCFLVPWIAANRYQFGIELFNNFKLVVVSVVLVNIFAAYAVYWFLSKKQPALCMVGVFLLVSLTVTGMLDAVTLVNYNRWPAHKLIEHDRTVEWIMQNTPPKARFLTNYHDIYNPALMAGRGLIYNFEHGININKAMWSVWGFDTMARYGEVSTIFRESDISRLRQTLQTYNIQYILLYNYDLTNPHLLRQNMSLIQAHFPRVHHDEARQISIYDVR